MKKIMSFLTAIAVCGIGASAQDISKADKLFDDGQFNAAFEEYQKVAAANPARDILYKAQLRSAESLNHLYKYEEAEKLMNAFALPAQPEWEARFLIYRAFITRQTLNAYSYSSDEEEGVLTREQKQENIKKDYERLFALSSKLIDFPIENETLIARVADTDAILTPTLFDFAAARIIANEQDTNKRLEVLKHVRDLGGKNRTLAKQNAIIDIILAGNDTQEKVAALEDIANNKTDKQSFLSRLFSKEKQYSPSTYEPRARARAGYEAAVLLNAPEHEAVEPYISSLGPVKTDSAHDYARAADICRYLIENAFDEYYTSQAKRMLEEIERPVLSVYDAPSQPAPENIILKMRVRNVDAVYTRVYEVGESFRNMDFGKREKYVLGRKILREFKTAVNYDKQHNFKDIEIKIPALEKGLYAAANSYGESFVSEKADITFSFINISDIMLLAAPGLDGKPADFIYDSKNPSRSVRTNIFEFYVLNPKTGAPVAGAVIDGKGVNTKTRADGTANEDKDITLNWRSYNNIQSDPVARHGGSLAFLQNRIYFNYSTQQPYTIFIETDRAIYRPGQEVLLKITAVERTPSGFITLGKKVLTLTARDANYNEFINQNLTLSDMGTASFKFAVPDGGLLGNYSINARFAEASGYANIRVEEYKRPEFEVELKDALAPWTYDKETKIEGLAKYYFGSPVADAEVEYTITRQEFIPYFYWWRRPSPRPAEEVAAGKVKTDADGNFSFDFKPTAGDNETSRFMVNINARDAGGRVISASKAYLAAKVNVFFSVDIPTGFMTAGKPYSFEAALVDINQTPIDGKFTLKLFTLEDAFEDKTNLDAAFEKTKEKEEVFSAEIVSAKKKQNITLPALNEGVYRMVFAAEGKEQKFILLSVHDGGTLNLPAVAIAEKAKYYPGEKARFLIGSGKIQTAKYFKILAQGFTLSKNIVEKKGLSLVDIPVGEEHRGGFNVSFFGVSDYQTFRAETSVSVPQDNRELTLKLDAPEAMQPGAKANWTIEARDNKNAPVNGEAFVRVYDKSLDYYAKIEPQLTLSNLALPQAYFGGMSSSIYSAFAFNYGPQRPYIPRVSPLPLPSLNMEFSGGRFRGAVYGRAGGRMVMYSLAEAAVAAAPTKAVAGVVNKQAEMAMDTAAVNDEGSPVPEAVPQIAVRENMAETAFFGPQIAVTNGKGSFSFTMPERLSAWNILATVLTRDVKLGTLAAQTVTKKDLMLRIEMPRFLREGDKSQIKAVINNETSRELKAEVTLTAEGLNFTVPKKTVTIKPNAQSVAVWDIDTPDGTAVIKVTGVVRAGSLSDGETKDLPVLPSRVRIADSKVIALKEGKNAVSLSLPEGVKREYEFILLRLDPGLFMRVLNAVPMLIDYSYCYETTTAIINRYAPLAVMNSMYKTYPELRSAVAKIPARDTVSPAWNDADPLRLMMLKETPWLNQSSGGKVFWGRMINIFEPKTVSKLENSALKKLENYQNSDGGFPWIGGGKSDIYITLYVLRAFAEAGAYGADYPKNTANKAVKFALAKVNEILKKTEREDEYPVSLALYAAYVISVFPSDWYDVKDVRAWLEFADKQNKFMTPLGKLYGANAWITLGDKTKAELYMDQILDMLQTDETTGAYFTPEAKSWMWYNDNLEQHAMALRTLVKLRPEDSRVDELLKWMMFNRKANEWKDAKAAAQSVYALMDVMKAKGAFGAEISYNVVWNDVKETLSYKPFEYVARAPEFSKTGADASDKYLSAEITKTGKTQDFASLSAVFVTHGLVPQSEGGLLNVERVYYHRKKDGDVYKLLPLENGSEISVGDELQVQLKVKTSSQFEYVMIADPKGAGFEADTLLSGWKWDGLSRYEEVRDSATNFFIDWLPHGEYILRYTLRPTTAGEYIIGPAQIQSMFAPEFAAHSAGFILKVK